MYSTPGISHSSFSMGRVTRCSTSAVDARQCDEDVNHRHDDLRLLLARERRTARAPSAIDPIMKSGVSFEGMKAAASRPATPYAGSSSASR